MTQCLDNYLDLSQGSGVSWTQELSSDRRVSNVVALSLSSERVSVFRRTIPRADDAWFLFRFTAVLERGLIFGMAGIEA